MSALKWVEWNGGKCPVPHNTLTDEECDNITKRYQSHEAIYGCAVSETLLEAARAYLKLQTQED